MGLSAAIVVLFLGLQPSHAEQGREATHSPDRQHFEPVSFARRDLEFLKNAPLDLPTEIPQSLYIHSVNEGEEDVRIVAPIKTERGSEVKKIDEGSPVAVYKEGRLIATASIPKVAAQEISRHFRDSNPTAAWAELRLWAEELEKRRGIYRLENQGDLERNLSRFVKDFNDIEKSKGNRVRENTDPIHSYLLVNSIRRAIRQTTFGKPLIDESAPINFRNHFRESFYQLADGLKATLQRAGDNHPLYRLFNSNGNEIAQRLSRDAWDYVDPFRLNQIFFHFWGTLGDPSRALHAHFIDAVVAWVESEFTLGDNIYHRQRGLKKETRPSRRELLWGGKTLSE